MDALSAHEQSSLLLFSYLFKRDNPSDEEARHITVLERVPMIFSGRTAIKQWWTPTDDMDQYTQKQIAWLHNIAKGPIRFNWFGVTDDCVFKGIEDADARGIDVMGLFDRREAKTPGELKKLTALYAAVPNARAKFFPGVSNHGSALLHAKICTVNAQIGDYSVPDGDFDTVEAAAAAGYPITWLSSWNPSGSGDEQFNFIIMIPSKIISASAVIEIAALNAWNREHHAAYQF